MIKFKDFYVSDGDYEEQIELFQNEHPNAEFLQITGGHMSPERIWFKYDDKLKEQPKLHIPREIAEEVEKVNRNRYTGAEEFSDIVYDWLYDPKFLGISEVSEEEYKKTGWVYSQTDRHEMNKLRNKRENIIRAYLAGKALGVEIVEVEE